MKTITLLVAIVLCSFFGFATNWTVSATNSQFTFTPSALTIASGDSVQFVLGSIHNAVEVSQATWNANGTTALAGGFSVPFGGGLVLPAQLPLGIHYYVCTNHASMGMKGTITVTKWVVSATNADFIFTPSTLTIASGDSVQFVLG